MALSAAATIAWTTPTGATGSASWASGASVTIPAGSRVTVALTTPSAAAFMSVSFTSDNLSWLGLGGTVPAALAFAFVMPLAPSAVRMTVAVDGLPPNNNATASAVGSIVYDTAGTSATILPNVIGGSTLVLPAVARAIVAGDSTNDQQPHIEFNPTPNAGDQVTVRWPLWDASDGSLGAHAPLVDGNGKNVEPYTGLASSGGYAATTTISSPGGRGTWLYDGTQWILVA